MTNHIGPMIAASVRLGMTYAQNLAKDIKATDFGRFAAGKEGPVVSNHPAFVCGHLSLYAPRIVAELGGDESSIAVPEGYQKLFSKDATCQDDTEGTLYPAMDELTAQLLKGYSLVESALSATEDAVFQQENPNEAMRSRFPTIGAMHGFYVGGHFMIHIGQWSAWRRAMGYGSI